MLQVLISAVTMISPDPILVRYMVAVIGALAGVGFYFVVKDLFGEKWAFSAALLYVTDPYFVALSTVPYQEILMLAALLFAFHLFYKERWLAASAVFAIACLSRYEAWAAAPVLAVAYVLRKDRSVGGWSKGVLLFGWMPALWILVHGGLSSSTHVVVEPSFSIWRLERWVHIAWVAVRNTPLPVLVLAVVGAWRFYRDRSLIDWRVRIQGAFVGLFLLAIPFSAHGVPPNPERYVTSREAVILIYFVLLLAALGLAQWPRLTPAIVAFGVILGAAGAYRPCAGKTISRRCNLHIGWQSIWIIRCTTVSAQSSLSNRSLRTWPKAILGMCANAEESRLGDRHSSRWTKQDRNRLTISEFLCTRGLAVIGCFRRQLAAPSGSECGAITRTLREKSPLGNRWKCCDPVRCQ